ncbi:hypothetical protein GOP47_0027853 [Adiantum capillus-veneris]|nr:hypothetical protein GOP47_0027853 [Adiantum capillus-veneris]
MKVQLGASVGRKRPLEADPLEGARQAWTTIRRLCHADLLDPRNATCLPYPGLGEPRKRPTADIQIVGIKDVATMIRVWNRIPAGHSVLLVGGKGVGKSVRLRVFVCTQFTLLPHKSRLVCIWDMDSLRDHFFQCLLDAFLFTCAEEKDVVMEIQSITSLAELKAFFLARKKGHGETFSFILDGAQDLDVKTCYGEIHSDSKEASLSLAGFLHGCRNLWGVSPKAEKTERERLHPCDDVSRLVCDGGFDAISIETFMSISALGAVSQKFPDRQADVHYYAGNYPWYLHILDGCCIDIALEKEVQARKADGMEISELEEHEIMGLVDVANLLEDQEDWDTALFAFVNHHIVEGIRNSLEKLRITKPCHDLREIACTDPRYALDEEKGLFSSPFIESLYIVAFREKEYELDKTEIAGPWVAYSKLVLRQPVVNWAEIGWICERLCTDVVSRMGIGIGDGLAIGELKAEHFSGTPKVCVRRLKLGHGFFFIPNRYNFGQVDGIVIHRDMSGLLHFVGLQFTTNEGKHRHSEEQFMSVSMIQEWIPDIMLSSGKEVWQLHFAFICLTSRQAEFKPENICLLKGGVCYGTLAHTLHVRSFSDALGPRKVGQDVHNVLVEMTQRREQEHSQDPAAKPFPPLPLPSAGVLRMSLIQLRQLRRAQLDDIASANGMDPKKYRTINLLVEALKAQGVLLVE